MQYKGCPKKILSLPLLPRESFRVVSSKTKSHKKYKL